MSPKHVLIRSNFILKIFSLNLQKTISFGDVLLGRVGFPVDLLTYDMFSIAVN